MRSVGQRHSNEVESAVTSLYLLIIRCGLKIVRTVLVALNYTSLTKAGLTSDARDDVYNWGITGRDSFHGARYTDALWQPLNEMRPWSKRGVFKVSRPRPFSRKNTKARIARGPLHGLVWKSFDSLLGGG